MIGASKTVAATTPTVVFNAFATPAEGSAQGDPGALTTNQVLVNAVGGSEPYVFSWLKLSGDDVTVSSASSSTVEFYASGGDGTTKSALYRCTVTDAVLSAIDVNVNVFFVFGDLS